MLNLHRRCKSSVCMMYKVHGLFNFHTNIYINISPFMIIHTRRCHYCKVLPLSAKNVFHFHPELRIATPLSLRLHLIDQPMIDNF